ncbi:hypothetical protein [Micromonospora sp. RP3T]|uniref:hypothetical protein n=1 Tax=Micromonospora sp. RP3T TaxID=2135446 RepID=UPI000D171144|nr:hypothetical protein [Micromonospora sp. RP3T]PTA45611.1 hypothetical protein C8054_14275 [Micromonospora sp. RP3T]
MTTQDTRPSFAPDAVVVLGALVATVGYLSPWFRVSAGYSWSFSGWAYASLSTGGGWTLLTLAWLLVALVAGGWARAYPGAALTALTAAVGALTFALAVVAASFAEFRERGSINWIADLPFGVGLPLMATGFGLLVAGGVRAVVRATLRAHDAPAEG